MEIKKLWQDLPIGDCDICENDKCKGHLDYDSICANVKYLNEYGEKNFEKNKGTFIELRKIMGDVMPTIFLFGCGLGLDYLGAENVFGNGVKYLPIEKCDWVIKKTPNYINFIPPLPQNNYDLETGVELMKMCNPRDDLVLCFFNSLFMMSENTDLKRMLLDALKKKAKFYFVVNYTINSNFHMPNVEKKFLEGLIKGLKSKISFNRFEVLDGRGIIIKGKKK